MAEAPIQNGKTIEKLGSIPRTPTLKVLAARPGAQQDLAFCFVYVKCWGTNAMFLLDLGISSAASSASQFS